MRDWRYAFSQNRGTLLAFVVLRRDVHRLHEQPPGRLQRQRCPDRGQQRRSAGAGGDGANLRRHHRRDRPLGRRGVRFDQLPCLVDRRRDGGDGRPRRRRRSDGRSRLRGCQWPHRDRRSFATDRRHDRHRRGLLRPRAPLAPDARRRRLWAARRRDDRPRVRRPAGQSHRARCGRPRRLGPLPALGDRKGGLRRGLLGAGGLHVRRPGRFGEIQRLRRSPASPLPWPASS